jgi:DNA-directed RNA polymerase subunit E"
MLIEEGDKCPSCGGIEFTEKFHSVAIIFNAEKSQIAQKLGYKMPGRYAIKIKEK